MKSAGYFGRGYTVLHQKESIANIRSLAGCMLHYCFKKVHLCNIMPDFLRNGVKQKERGGIYVVLKFGGDSL